MNSDESMSIYQEYLQYISEIIAKYEEKSEYRYKDVREDMSILSEKINDENLYLGVVGSFSSGKSTFINSVIHKNLLPTDAVQGTTVAASILKKSDKDDVEIVFNDGNVVRFSDDQNSMIERYQISKPETIINETTEKTFWDKLLTWIKKIFGLYKKTEETVKPVAVESCIELFKKLISTEDLALDIKYVTLYYKDANIPYQIAMVDTPGTESLNKRHNEVTKNAIDNICDAIVVIIPYDEPVSEELLNYINTNLNERKDDCIFVVTKIELLGDIDELSRLIRVIKRRLENGLSIENAQVIPMPTLIYLKSVDKTMTTKFLDNISDDEKKNFIEMYESGMEEISNTLEKKRYEYIQHKIISICERTAVKISDNLALVVTDYGEKEQALRAELVDSIDQFEYKSKNDIDIQYETSEEQLKRSLSNVQLKYTQLISSIENVISGCESSQDLIVNLNFSCKEILKEINLEFINDIENVKLKYNDQLKKSQKEFIDLYSRCGIDTSCLMMVEDRDTVIEGDFISECEDLLKKELENLKFLILDDTSGLINKFKSFFSNPINKHKEIVLRRLLNLINDMIQKTMEYGSNRLRNMNVKYKQIALNNLDGMISINSFIIENYMYNTQNAIEINIKRRKEAEEDIKNLNNYINMIKEAV